jgi:hypothetical protein
MDIETRQKVVPILATIMVAITSLILLLGGNELYQDVIGATTENTPVVTAPPTEAIPRIEYTPTQEIYASPQPTQKVVCTVQLKVTFNYGYANIRKGANIHTQVIGKIYPGEQYIYGGDSVNEWYLIEIPNGLGYVADWVSDLNCN